MCDRELQSNASWELIRDAGGDDVGDRAGRSDFCYCGNRGRPDSIRSVRFAGKSAEIVVYAADFADSRLLGGLRFMATGRGKRDAPEPGKAAGAAGDSAVQQRAERLAAIRRAIEAGEYDSEELLAKAFDRMLQRYQSGFAAD